MNKKLKELQEQLEKQAELMSTLEKRLDVMEGKGKGIPDKPLNFPDTESHRWG
ncbi:hypothetical protein [Lactococcus lactis]|uniref:hypothetical protein n=1 Tax=Lactococcus lactis TaxID=1358 RepID=UPI00072C03EE|nr:hypothetical protein [Lactococcus lactis]KST89927.1 hypothetical protein LKF24_2122 [Lactococcus lactis subsp. lactis]